MSGELANWVQIERECCGELTALVADERSALLGQDLNRLAQIGLRRERIQVRWARAVRARPSPLELAEAEGKIELEVAVRALRRAQNVNQALIAGLLRSLDEVLAQTRLRSFEARYDSRAGVAAPPMRASVELRA